jgi:hypothetical protein
MNTDFENKKKPDSLGFIPDFFPTPFSPHSLYGGLPAATGYLWLD